MQHSSVSLKGVPPYRAAALFASLDMRILDGNRNTPPRFPLELFGDWRPWLSNTAEKTNAPFDYVMAGLLSTVTTLIGNARWVSPSDGWETPLNIWMAAVGDPSSGKSPALNAALSNLRILENEMAEGFADEMREYECLQEVATVALEAWKIAIKVAVKENNPRPTKPEEAVMPAQPTPAPPVCHRRHTGSSWPPYGRQPEGSALHA